MSTKSWSYTITMSSGKRFVSSIASPDFGVILISLSLSL
jgi:hypothetical protein